MELDFERHWHRWTHIMMQELWSRPGKCVYCLVSGYIKSFILFYFTLFLFLFWCQFDITWFTAYRVDSEWSTTSGRIDIWAELVSSVRQKIPEYLVAIIFWGVLISIVHFDSMRLMDLVIELKRLPLSSLSFHSGRHPASHELSNMTSEALRKTLDVTYFAPKTSLIMYLSSKLDHQFLLSLISMKVWTGCTGTMY